MARQPFPNEVTEEIEELDALESRVTHVLGDEAGDRLRSQKQVLENKMEEEDVWEAHEHGEPEELLLNDDNFQAAMEAVRWMNGEADAPSEKWHADLDA